MHSSIELYIIEKVKQKRIELGFTQLDLSQKLEMSDSFIAHVESPTRRAKYNINHLNEIAKILGCSPREFWPEMPL